MQREFKEAKKILMIVLDARGALVMFFMEIGIFSLLHIFFSFPITGPVGGPVLEAIQLSPPFLSRTLFACCLFHDSRVPCTDV